MTNITNGALTAQCVLDMTPEMLSGIWFDKAGYPAAIITLWEIRNPMTPVGVYDFQTGGMVNYELWPATRFESCVLFSRPVFLSNAIKRLRPPFVWESPNAQFAEYDPH